MATDRPLFTFQYASLIFHLYFKTYIRAYQRPSNSWRSCAHQSIPPCATVESPRTAETRNQKPPANTIRTHYSYSSVETFNMASHLTKADAHLLSVPGAKRKKQITMDPSSSAFASTLSSLISSSTSSKPEVSRGRARPSKNKPDIFTSHNKGAKARAARDLEDSEDRLGRAKMGRQDIGGVDEAVLARSKKALEEKSRKYRALKHSTYVPDKENGAGLIEWDRKWAENGRREFDSASDDNNDGEGGTNPKANEIVEYEDEFGRLRTGTRTAMERMERKKRNELLGAEELERMSARPKMPENLIVGPAVQAMAFSMDEESERKMEELAKKRDRSLTPPPAEHYDARKEFRQRGTGFFAFSKDEEERQEQMRSLEEQRRETERVRKEKGLDMEDEKPQAQRIYVKEKSASMEAPSLMARMRVQTEPDRDTERRTSAPDTDSKTDDDVNEGGSGLMARMRARMMAENFLEDLENEIPTAKRPKTDDK